ncbi:MAG: DUF5106 domain-containing protein [Cytophagaceae bacterium]|jgi:thiol-disulfide isomerase/thioredoxin|nr:DUF5106 domain-containing protein [Cytophagaceae bacterium]
MNKKSFVGLVTILLFAQQAFAYSIKVKVNGVKNDTCFLGHYFGQKQYTPVDTAVADALGNFQFAKKKDLKQGVYLVIIPNTYFELIISAEQDIKIETDTANLISFMKTKGSVENDQFYAFQKFMMEASKEAKDFKDPEAIKAFQKKVEQYKSTMFATYPSSFTSKILRAADEPKMPDFKREDSLQSFYYYRSHFFDNYDFTDERMLRTPIFIPRIERFMNDLTAQAPDSIIRSLKMLFDKAEAGNKEIFKYCVSTYANKYETSNIMCMDKVFVWVGKNYYMKGKCFWADTAVVRKITERVTILEPLTCDKVIPNTFNADTAGTYLPLHGVTGKYIVAIFWDADCGHCQKEVPKLFEIYKTKLKARGVKIYAVTIERDDKSWLKFLKEKKLFTDGWYNVRDKYNHTDFHKTFDVYSTPVIYLVDDKKRIIAKRLGVEQIEDFLNNYEKIKKK